MSILALHGFTGLGSDFEPFAEMCGGTWHCPNLPGHGPNPQLDCGAEAVLRFIQDARHQSSRDEQPQALLGYSMGARAALLHAVTYPDAWQALILISPHAGIEDHRERQRRSSADDALAQRIDKDGAPSFLDYWQETPVIKSQQHISPAWRHAMRAKRMTHTAQGLSTSLREFGQGNYPNLWGDLPKLKMPTLLITGADDMKYTQLAGRMTQSLGGRSQHIIIPGAGHMPHLEAPRPSAQVIRDFLVLHRDAT